MDMVLLDIKNLKVEFHGRRGHVVAAEDVNLIVRKGEILGLVGESGAGKSTIGNAVMDILEPPGRIAGGQISILGEALPLGDENAMRQLRGNRIGMIFQDPFASLNPLFSVSDQLVETLMLHKSQGLSEAREKAVNLMEQVGIPDASKRIDDYPHQFSGGMRQRVVIALALAGDPDLLIADEPTTALDTSVQSQILALIRKLTKDRALGVLLITHDMGVIAETANRVAVMYRGKIVEMGDAVQVLTRPGHEYTQSLMAAVPPPDKKIKKFVLMKHEDSLSDAERIARRQLHRDWSRPYSGENPILEVRNLKMVFASGFFQRNARPVVALDDVNFHIMPGESLGLGGESGSGKTTVARIVAGLHRPDQGCVVYEGRNISELSRKESRLISRHVQMIFQNPYSSLNPRFRVGAIIDEPLRFYEQKLSFGERKHRMINLLTLVGLPADAANRWPHEFSGGQRQRIAIARALAASPRLLICDEPTSALDVSIQAQILNLLKELQEELSLSMLFISHDLPVMRQMCDRIGIMQMGKLLEVQETEQLFTHPQTKYTANLLSLMPKLGKSANAGAGA